MVLKAILDLVLQNFAMIRNSVIKSISSTFLHAILEDVKKGLKNSLSRDWEPPDFGLQSLSLSHR